MNYNTDNFLKGMAQLDISLTEHQIEQFMKYYEILTEWNSFMNLTTIKEFDEVMLKHFIDSLTIVKAYDMQGVKALVDIGTGAGFPGIPIKIVFPHIKVVLLDSLRKRLDFLDKVISELGLTEIETLHGRAEDFAKKSEYREQFDLVVSRAVANLSSLSEYCLPYVRVGGTFIPYKSGKVKEEILEAKKAVGILGGEIKDEIDFYLPGSEDSRSLIVIRKSRQTPKKYPRKAGLPTKEPLK